MTAEEKVDKYIEKHPAWNDQLSVLRSVFQASELKEEVKWGAPHYTYNGKLVAGLAAFKNHCAIWFHQGVFLKDEKKMLMNAQEGVTRGLRQWRFDQNESIDNKLVKSYVEEAIQNCKDGKEIKPQRKKIEVVVPAELSDAFKKNKTAHQAFNAMTPGKQKEYANYISEAKREATKLSRLEKILPMIEAGGGLYDKYKNC